jgi:hypothetical protein
MTESASPEAGDTRDQFIPVRKTALIDALLAQDELSGPDKERFLQLCALLGSIFHFEYFEQLEHLREAYFHFSPEHGASVGFDEAFLERGYQTLRDAFIEVLKKANFVEIPQEEIVAAHSERSSLRVPVDVRFADFREVRFFRRGRHEEEVTVRSWFGLRKQVIPVETYDNVVVVVATRPGEADAEDRRTKQLEAKARPGCVLIKYFRNIRRHDLTTLFPNVRVVMSLADKLKLGVPAIAGGVPILFKLIPALATLIVVVSVYLGWSAHVEGDELKRALAAVSALAALGGFLMAQRVKYERQSLKYQKQITDNIYFRNISNNGGVFEHIIGAAEEQECKEAFLAYYFLLTAGSPLTMHELDVRVETWLRQIFAVDVDFEVDDGVAKLYRLGVLGVDDGKLYVPDLGWALARLDKVWDDFFQFEFQQSPPAAQGAAR